MVWAMEEWIRGATAIVTAIVAVAALVVSIWASRRVARKREFEILLERSDREAAKREQQFEREAAKREEAIRALMERSDREAAKREQQFEREAAKREEAIRALMERSDREAAKREQQFEREATKREQQFEREAAKREEAIRALMERSDRKFEAVLARNDELSRQSAEVTERVSRTEAVLETVRAGGQRAAVQPAPSTGETEAVAAQGVPGGRPTE